jgi:arsenate reductase (thioredoxin)
MTNKQNLDKELTRHRQAKVEGRKTILFICTANAVRSQMAEALVNHYLRDHWEAFSAGFLPLKVHPGVVKVLKEIGFDASGQASKHLDLFKGLTFDKVITLCSDADAVCAYYPDMPEWTHIPFEDPALHFAGGFGGTGLFKSLRKEMEKKLLPYLEERPVLGSRF